MAHYAQIKDGLVVTVFVGRDDVVEGIDDWETHYAPAGSIVKQTSYNTRGGVHYDPETGEPSEDQTKALRKNYAGVGYTYDADKDAFIAPKPDPTEEVSEWVLNEETCLWEPVSEA